MSENKGFLKRAFENMKEDAVRHHKIDAENFNSIKEISKRNFEEQTKMSPDMEEFVNAKGFKVKFNVILSHMERNAKALRGEDRERYESSLCEMRKKFETITDKN
ncbi:hypothetical protein [Ruminococcus sp.]|uniref:hypothetical protein n=1 Tax=Ruminococcus sp. TaxID=41978 RepID=UPI003F0EAE46